MASLGYNELTYWSWEISYVNNCQANFSDWWLRYHWWKCKWTLQMNSQPWLLQVMAWGHQATSRYLCKCCLRSMLSYDVTRLQWVKQLGQQHRDANTLYMQITCNLWNRNNTSEMEKYWRCTAFKFRTFSKHDYQHSNLESIVHTNVCISLYGIDYVE